MSEPIPESIPTSADPRSRRPVKKARGANTPVAAQSAAVTALFEKQPFDREIHIPISATAGPRTAASLGPPPEIVANVQGSSAGAGSGEFHVYKASRRREYERVRLMEDEAKREEAEKEWKEKMEQNRKRDEEKTSKNAKRREKSKARKAGSKLGEGNGVEKDKQAVKEKRGIDLTAARPASIGESNGTDEAIIEVPVDENKGIVIHDDD